MPSQTNPNRILVVDDNPLVTRALTVVLRDQGFDPIVFASGQPALEFARLHRPDMALIDIHLPDMSGLELSHAIREYCGEEMPIVIVSGDTTMETLRSLPAVGATHFFSKPINTAHLLSFLREWKDWRTTAKA